MQGRFGKPPRQDRPVRQSDGEPSAWGSRRISGSISSAGLTWTAAARCRLREASLLAVERFKVMPRRSAPALALASGVLRSSGAPESLGPGCGAGRDFWFPKPERQRNGDRGMMDRIPMSPFPCLFHSIYSDVREYEKSVTVCHLGRCKAGFPFRGRDLGVRISDFPPIQGDHRFALIDCGICDFPQIFFRFRQSVGFLNLRNRPDFHNSR